MAGKNIDLWKEHRKKKTSGKSKKRLKRKKLRSRSRDPRTSRTINTGSGQQGGGNPG